MNRTLKRDLKNILLDRYGLDMKKHKLNSTRVILKINKGNQQVFCDLIDETFNYYNNHFYSSLNSITPAEQLILQQEDHLKHIPAEF